MIRIFSGWRHLDRQIAHTISLKFHHFLSCGNQLLGETNTKLNAINCFYNFKYKT